jgi:hypothetical protein
LEESDRAMFELFADDTLGPEAEPVAIEADRPLQIVDAEGDERNARFHESSF